MELIIMNTSFQIVGIIDSYESILWVERYNEYSEFELYMKFDYTSYGLLQPDYYLKHEGSNKVMIIETVSIKEDPEQGSHLVVSGRSLESLLDRRIVLRQIIIDGSLQNGIQTILDREIINGIFPERNFPNFSFSVSSDPIITTPTIETQYYMDNVYEIISLLCVEHDIGFNVHLNTSNHFVFNLYAGANRSRDQILNPYVIFSREFDNLLGSEYFFSKKNKRTFCFISGQEGLSSWNQNYYGRWAQVWTNDVGTGLTRREMFLDANNLQTSYDGTTDPIPDADFVAQLQQRGYIELAERQEQVDFNGSIDVSGVYKYNQDYYLGDLVELEDSYGNKIKVRIKEMTESVDTQNGHRLYPTLEKV